MTDGITVSLDPSHFRYKISGRLTEIAGSILYYKINTDPSVALFRIPVTDRETVRKLRDIIKEASSGITHLPFLIDGYVEKTPGREAGLSMKVVPSEEMIRWVERAEELMDSAGTPFRPAAENRKEYYIPAMDYTGFIGSKVAWTAVSPGGIGRLLGAVTRAKIRPAHWIRKFVLPADALRVELKKSEGGTAIFDMPLARWIPEKNTCDLKASYGIYRKARGYEGRPLQPKAPDIYLSSDLHLGHKDIIWGGSRPFPLSQCDQMDEFLVRNWNETIGPSDRVYYLGDLTYNLGEEESARCLARLSGEIVFINGNHDTGIEGSYDSLGIEYKGRRYYLIHNPGRRPEDEDGWLIHGHTHNSRIAERPFIDFQEKTVNVCCEMTGYRPVPLSCIHEIIDMHQKDEGRYLLMEDALRDLKKRKKDPDENRLPG